MAYNDSGELPIGQSYQLGEYVFSIRVTPDPGEGTTGINVRCDKGDERAVVSGEVTGTVESWSVEANDDTADVYVTLAESSPPINEPLYTTTVENGQLIPSTDGYIHDIESTGPIVVARHNADVIVAAKSSNQRIRERIKLSSRYVYAWGWIELQSSFTYAGQTVYYRHSGIGYIGDNWPWLQSSASFGNINNTAWTMVYGGKPAQEPQDVLVARFAIDIREAGGGPDGDWDEPGSDGPPDKTLYITATGPTAGDASAWTPPEREVQEQYGSGGNGGHGGGGGAGASAVIIYDFATSRAGRVVQEANSGGPGPGGKGGNGGRGGDGCILIFW